MERYKPIIDDWNEFRQESDKHPVSAARKNQIKARENFKDRLEQDFEDIVKASWNSDIFRLGRLKNPGKSLLHWRGEYYVQEESAALPVEILNPRENDKILDMCAAPGGKTTQIASNINNKGLIIANDNSSKRLQSLQPNIYRTGSYCVKTTNYDGQNFPDKSFDKVLVDAPCSGEGNRFRRNFESSSEEERENLSKLQKRLLERAIEITNPDGAVVYSTCTFAPEENEAVVDHVLERENVEIEEINLDISHRNGLQDFQEDNYSKKVSNCIRVYPHHLKSGGIFVAKLRKN